MKWVVDVGNSAIRWMPVDRSDPAGKVYWQHDTIITALDQAWGAVTTIPTDVICSCVAGDDFRQAMTQWCQQNWQIEPLYIRSPANGCGVENAYHIADHLGADRWAAIVAAHELYQQPVCIVDCGTAITIDVIEANGSHQGGLIFPGLNVMKTALLDHTDIELEESESGNSRLFARNTADALGGGGLYTVIAALDRIVADVAVEMKRNLINVITGGDAESLIPLLSGDYDHHPDLVLDGLVKISESCLEACT